MGEHELPQIGVQREAVHAVAHGEHQHGGGAVQGITRSHLAVAGLQKIGLGHIAAAVLHLGLDAQHRKNAAHRHIHVDVAGAVQRVEHQQVFAARVLARNLVGLLHLFRGHARQVAGPFGAADKDLVAQHVELLLGFALHVDTAALFFCVLAHGAAQFPQGDGPGDGFAGNGHVQDQGVEVATGTGKAAALLNQELGQGGAVA